MHVCRAWREIALSNSALWDTPRLAVDKYHHTFPHVGFNPPTLTNFLMSWIRRAGDRPISLSLRGNEQTCFGRYQSYFVPFMVRIAPRVRSLELHVVGGLQFGPEETVHWPLLEEITIGKVEARHLQPDFKTFVNAPQLRRLHLMDGVNPFYTCANVPWGQLTVFSGEFGDLGCLSFLRQAVNLVECSLFFVDMDESMGADLSMLSLPCLQILQLVERGSGWGPLASVLDCLILPALQDLEVTGVTDLDAESYFPFLTRNCARLQFLAVEAIPCEYFHQMPKLTSIDIWAASAESIRDFFCRLQDPEARFLPQIEHISFFDCPLPTHSDAEMMARVLSSRWNAQQDGIAEIQSFCFQVADSYTKEEVVLDDLHEISRPLAELAANGKWVYVGTEGKKCI
ncbi:hypothetical protein B0H10DRAFT_2040310 [Mycena sp. CBHHK59/15]|nr:hypothetical protein B0H10DRAFT_2040310 [Mycena sp. CBHHK59/15]